MIDGTYPGKIEDAYCEEDQQEEGALVLCFDVALENGETCTARHRTVGKHGWSGRAVIEKFDFPWPTGIHRIPETVGRDVQVRLKTNVAPNGKTYQNAYIVTGRRRLDPETVRVAVERLAGAKDDPDNIPF